MKKEVKTLLERAEKFERDARFDFEHEDYELAMFHIEQSAQLIIKAKLLDIKGSFKKTHNLRELLREIADIHEKEKINHFLEKNKVILRNLERAYISSRYFYEEFFKEEVEEGFRLLKELKKLLWSQKTKQNRKTK